MSGHAGPGRHRDSSKDPWWWRWIDRVRPRLDRPAYTALCAGLAAAGLVWAIGAYDVSTTRGWPAERAEVVAVKTRRGFFNSCGKGGGPERDITWHSTNPPAGLPATFLDKGECLDTEPGEVWTVVRVPDGDGVRTFVNPTRTYPQAAADALVVGGIGFSAILVILLLRRWWIDRRDRGYLR